MVLPRLKRLLPAVSIDPQPDPHCAAKGPAAAASSSERGVFLDDLGSLIWEAAERVVFRKIVVQVSFRFKIVSMEIPDGRKWHTYRTRIHLAWNPPGRLKLYMAHQFWLVEIINLFLICF